MIGHTFNQSFESFVNVARYKGASFDESKLALISEFCGILFPDFSQFMQVCFVSDKHYYDPGIGILIEFLEPPLHGFKSLELGNVKDQKCTHCSSIVGACYSSVPLLASSVPYLCFHYMAILEI
jgi:hypothetical protein